jgi:hypothetical protein
LPERTNSGLCAANGIQNFASAEINNGQLIESDFQSSKDSSSDTSSSYSMQNSSVKQSEDKKTKLSLLVPSQQ